MIWGSIPSDQCLHLWKELRTNIQESDQETQLNAVAKFCAYMPFGHRTLDYHTPDSWPTPWEILYHGSFCKSSISLLMAYTLQLVGNKSTELILIDDEDDIYLLPLIDNQYILNYHLGEISNYPALSNEFKVLKTYSPEQIKKIT